jgi:hypothetical protein
MELENDYDGDILLDTYNHTAERADNYRKTGLAAAVDVAHKAL